MVISFFKKVYRTSARFGLDPKKFIKALKPRKRTWFDDDLEVFLKQKKDDTSFEMPRLYPILADKEDAAGVMTGHYFHQDLFVAQQIYRRNPVRHLDIGSRIDGFVTHVATFREIEILDIRNVQSMVGAIKFERADLMQLPEHLIECCDSISSLHAIEHFGLGRYGDPVDYWGHEKAVNNIAKLVKKGGVFYFSVPIGPQIVEFNAHRIFAVNYLMELLEKNFDVIEFSFVDDKGDFHNNVPLTQQNRDQNFGCSMGCGIFVCVKK